MDSHTNSFTVHRSQFNYFTKLLTMIAGVDDETLRQCPSQDVSSIRAVSILLLSTAIYSASIFSVIAQRLFGEPGHLGLRLIATSIAIALFIIAIDSYVFLRCSWFESGVTELARGGLDISGGSAARIKSGVFLSVRVGLSLCLAMLTGTFFSLIVFDKDIQARIEHTYQVANTALVRDATEVVDAEIGRTTDAVNTKTTEIASLYAQITSLRQNEIDSAAGNSELQPAQQEIAQLLAQREKAADEQAAAEKFATDELAGIKTASGNSGIPGVGPRRRAALENIEHAKIRTQQATEALNAARTRADMLREKVASANEAVKQRAENRLPAYESSLADENTKLATLKDRLADLTNRRNDTIRKAVESAPNYVPHNTGFLAQITALEQIANEDGKIASVIILFDLVSVGFELAAVLAKVMAYCPTTYAMIVARDVFLRAVRTVDEMMEEINHNPKSGDNRLQESPWGRPANDNGKTNRAIVDVFSTADAGGLPDDPSQPPKRKRGRPKKNLLH